MSNVRRHMRALPRLGPSGEAYAIWLRLAIWSLAISIGIWVLLSSSTYYYWSISAGVGFIPALAAIAAQRPDRFRLESKLRVRDSNRVQLLGPLCVVSVALAMRALASYDIVPGPNVFLYSGLSGLCISLLIWASVRHASIYASFGVGMIFCTAVVVHVNGASTSKAYVLFKGSISKKYVARRGAARMLVVSSERQETHMRVSEVTFGAYSVGAEACVFARRGILGIEIRSFGSCHDGV